MVAVSKARKPPTGTFWTRMEVALQLYLPVLLGVILIATTFWTGRALPMTADVAFLIGFALVFGPLLLLFHFGSSKHV